MAFFLTRNIGQRVGIKELKKKETSQNKEEERKVQKPDC